MPAAPQEQGKPQPRLAISSLFQYNPDYKVPYTTLANSGYKGLIEPAHHHGLHGDMMYSLTEMRDLGRFVKGLGLNVRDVHGTHGIDPTDPKRGMCWSLDEDVRRNGVELIKNRVLTAAELGASTLTLHVAADPIDQSLVGASDTAIKRTIQEAGTFAREHGVRVALENLHYPTNKATRITGELLQEFPEDTLGVCVDTGHVNCDPEDGFKFIDSYKDRIIAVHINDNTGAVNGNATDDDASAGDKHMLLYSGTTNWSQMADALHDAPYFLHGGAVNMEIGHRRHPEIPTVEQFLDMAYDSGMKFVEELRLAQIRAELKSH